MVGPDQYQCDACGEVYDKGWSDEEAAAEYATMHGRAPDLGPDDHQDAVVCDDCFKAMSAFYGWLVPETT